MVEKPKKAPKSWNNTAPLDWGPAPKQQLAPKDQTFLTEPGKFDEISPVRRPDVPEIEEKVPQNVRDNSILSGFMDVMDNITPDDMGGLVRGTSGWLSEVPLYRETVGTALGVPLSAAESVINAVNWGSEQMNHLGAALFSAMPGGIDTLTWDQSQDISLGQVVTANAAINNSRGVGGWLINAVTFQQPWSILAGIGEKQDPDNVLYSDNFDILNPEQRAEAFEAGGMGQFSSGFADAIWLVAADPTIVGGKVTNVIRLGTKAGEFGGIANRALRTTQQISRFAGENADQASLIKSLGVDGARKSGRLTATGEYLIDAMQKNADELVNHPYVKSSPSQRDTRALLGYTSIDRPEEAAALVGAIAGDADSWVKLRTLNQELYVEAAQRTGVDVFAPVGDKVFDSVESVRLSDDQISIGDNLVAELGSTRPDLFPELQLLSDSFDPRTLASTQTITRGGSRGPAWSVRAANAWRTGKQRNQFENNAFKKSSAVTSTAANGHYVYDVIEGISGSRPLRVVRWLGQGTPTGIIDVKQGADSAMSLRSLTSWLRKSPIDPTRSSQFVNRFAAARTPAERTQILREAEQEASRVIAAKHGVSEATAMAAYNKYASKRAAMLQNIQKSQTKFAVDPDTGELVKVPQFYAELDPSYAMLDTKVFNRVIGGNKSWLRTVEDTEYVGDQLNTYWKLSVLLRLGYTQRNIAEGALRSFAVLGMVAANPRAWATLPGNTYQYAGARYALSKARRQEKALVTSYENLQAAKNIVARSDEMMDLSARAQAAADSATALRAKYTTGGAKLTDAQRAEINKLRSEARKLKKKSDDIRKSFGPTLDEDVAKARENAARITTEIDAISSDVERLLTVVRSKTAKRKRGGYSENIVDGAKLQGAFQGTEGSIAAKASSADRTTYMAIDNAVQSRINALESMADFKRIDPAKLKPGQMQTYFDEYATRINYRYRSDPVGRMILENQPIGRIKAWLASDAGKGYRDSLSISGRKLDSEEAVDEWIDHLVRRLDNEMPPDTKLRALALDHELTPSEVAAALRGRDLPQIVGRLYDDMPSSFFARGKRGVDTLSDKIMRGLGSIPETKLLRHPFYNRVYMDRQAQLWRNAADQGLDMGSPLVKNRINKAAHQSALKATRETMYTIEELSNAAVLLRYVSPFFPAFENSLRTWGRIGWNNPAVIGYGNILWNIPNNLGWVVNENGEKVESSNFFMDEGNFIIWPEPVADFLRSTGGPFTPGEALRTRQHGANVIFQGGQWWFPGAGPATSIPLSFVLRGKPEDTEILRNMVGEEIFMQLVPSGNPNVDLVDALLPTIGRRVRQMWNGESSDTAFLATWNQIIEDEYIAAQLEGRPFTDADAARTKEKLDRFWGWQIAAAAVAPFQSSIVSRFQVQRDYWNKLIDDQSLSYPDKIKALQEQFPDFGDALMAITRSGSYTETKLQPNLKTWQRISKNKDIVDKLYAIDPELVGMFGNMGTFDDPFSRAVYGEFGRMTIGPNDARVRRMMKPDEIIRNNQVKDGWTEWWQIKDYVEEKVIKLGYSSLQVDEAEPLRQILDRAASDIGAKYPAWAEERKSYDDKLPAFIQGARVIVQNGELMDEDPTVAALSDYLDVREYISEALSQTKDNDQRKQLKLIGYKAAWDLRQADVGFADFYDQYLYRDDFRKL